MEYMLNNRAASAMMSYRNSIDKDEGVQNAIHLSKNFDVISESQGGFNLIDDIIPFTNTYS
jgi:hypothetical protein